MAEKNRGAFGISEHLRGKEQSHYSIYVCMYICMYVCMYVAKVAGLKDPSHALSVRSGDAN